MPRITANVQNTDANGNPAPLGAGNAAYDLVTPGTYTAVMTKCPSKTYLNENDGIKYLMVTPEFRLVNEAGTLINRQDFTIGCVDDTGALIMHPKGKTLIWAGKKGALYLFQALGILQTINEETGEYAIDADTDHLFDRVIMVKVGQETYTKTDPATGAKVPAGVKNVILKIEAMNPDDARNAGYLVDDVTGAVFESETAQSLYTQLEATGTEAYDPGF